MPAALRSLEDHHPLVTPNREGGCSYYLTSRHYPSGDVEITALKLFSDDKLRSGGGAKRKNGDKGEMDDATLAKSVQRARQMVRRKLLTMCADRMLTLTFRENVTSIDESWDCFKYFCRLMRDKYGDKFSYVAVPEYQKRGAVHFHLAIKGHYSVKVVRVLWLRAVGRRRGNIDITSPKKFGKSSWNPRRIANYLSKYITKTESVEFNRRRYSSGGGIEIPECITGWLAYGLTMSYELRKAIGSITDLPVVTVWESGGYFGVTYLST